MPYVFEDEQPKSGWVFDDETEVNNKPKPWEQYEAHPTAKPWERYQTESKTGYVFEDEQPKSRWVFEDEPQENIPLSSVPWNMVKNFGSDAARIGGDLANVVKHPVDTLEGIGNLLIGATQNAGGALVDKAVGLFNPELIEFNNKTRTPMRAEKVADAMGSALADDYGGYENIKRTLSNKPVQSLLDVSLLFGGGAAATSKLPKVSTTLGNVSTAINPINITGQAIKGVGKVAGRSISEVSGVLTGQGSLAIREAAKAGYKGGTSYLDNALNRVPMTDVLDMAKANLRVMGEAKQKAYRSGIAQTTADKLVLNMGGIDKALKQTKSITSHKGQVINKKAAKVRSELKDAVNKWKNLPPEKFHTPEGLDALKRQVGGILDEVPFTDKASRSVAGDVYHAIKSEITKQSPVYAETMKNYVQASDEIREIERALSLGKKASIDTSMRKLQSLMRNNVNTNYGSRTGSAKNLSSQGGDLFPALAGQSANQWMGRGVIGQGGNVATLAASLFNPALLSTLPLQSPRIAGLAAYGMGSAARGVSKAGKYLPSAKLLPLISQAVKTNDASLLK